MNITKKEKKVLVSGIKPTGILHLGNYFGAIKQMIDLVNSKNYESYIFLADYHSMTSLIDSKERINNSKKILAAYLAFGLNKNKVNIFKQSDIKNITELSWIFSTITPLSMLFLSHAYKDKISNEKEIDFKNINAGLFNYPILMASDILIYNADIVPVGKDQEQHIEYTREIAKKYNNTYKTNTFKYPESFFIKNNELVTGIDGRKMSKSYNNTIPIFEDENIIKKLIMSIKTDSKTPSEKKDPDESIIFNIHKLFLNEEKTKELRDKFINSEKKPYSYKEAKEDLFDTILSYFKKEREKYNYFINTKKGERELLSIIKNGAKNANKRTEKTINTVRKETGLEF